MAAIAQFFEYAQEFEKTFVDDDWARLERYFEPDAVYEVRNVPFGCRLEGRAAIFRGIKKSLDGFDRRFATREIALEGAPEVAGDTVSLSWAVTYGRAGSPPLVLRGRSTATYADGVIARLADSYDASAIDGTTSWLKAYGRDLDPSYV